MTKEELEEIFRELEAQGWEPKLCDTPVPFFDTRVPCGEPNQVFDDCREEVLLPRDLLSMQPEFCVRVKGESMCDAGIADGDIVRVLCTTCVHDGDIVVASIDGSSTIKTYCEDDEGQPWLVPENDAFRPIALRAEDNVRIIGKVLEIIKDSPRISFRHCMKKIQKEKSRQMQARALTVEQVTAAIQQVAPLVKMARQWYAVYRAMVDKELVRKEDYDGFIERVTAAVPEQEHLPVRDELQRMAVDSFAKPVSSWREDDSPVKGKRFEQYLNIAEKMLGLLDA
ncbi:MAG: hypothetical protein J5545_03330 [Bacteroidaceae bacterium]|nr:hypothetical protein [Bacteroidaceae bacterium]